MPNDMMIAALNKQRAGKMEVPASTKSPEPENPMGIEERIEALEQKYDEICSKLGMDKEAPKEVARGY